MKALHIAVLKGGPSREREISLASGTAVAEALRGGGHRVTEIDVTEASLPALPADTDLVFPALHGFYGEDGQVQQELDAAGLPYVGSGAEQSRLMIDKALTCDLLREHGIDCPASLILNSPEEIPESLPALPLVVKPCSQGSTIGMTLLREAEGLRAAVDRAFACDSKVMLEEYVEGIEATVGLIDGKALPVMEIIPPGDFFDYDAKYVYSKGETQYNCPPLQLPEDVQREMQLLAERIYRITEARDLLRVDVIYQPESGRITVLEPNTMPGFTASSLLPKSARSAGISFTELCCSLALAASRRSRG